jgi:uncharacterized membrane-anchored protein
VDIKTHTALVGAAFLFSLLGAMPARGDDMPPHDSIPDEATAAFDAANDVAQAGPVKITLRDQAVLNLPDGYVFIPPPEAARVMKALGNSVHDTFLGLVFPGGNEDWFVVADYDPSGYINDADAKDWDVDELFANIKAGTEASNDDRRAAGFPELDVVGWVERPQYDAVTHRLVWSLSAQDRGALPDSPQTINYNTYLLGREGYVSLNLVTDSAAIDAAKDRARTLLGALEFQSGKTYADFAPATDKVAQYGLAALIGGIAAKKLGMFALAAAFFAKFAKVLLLAGAVAAGVVAKFFRRKKPDDHP